MKSKLIAISAITSALIAIILTAGTYLSFIDLFCLAISSVVVMLPLYYDSYLASFISFFVGGIIAFMLTGFNFTIVVIPAFFAFFGCYPLVKNFLEKKKINKIFTYVLGLIWGVAAIYGIYFFYVEIMHITTADLPKFVQDNALIFVGILGVAFYIVFERFVTVFKRIIDIYLNKILKK